MGFIIRLFVRMGIIWLSIQLGLLALFYNDAPLHGFMQFLVATLIGGIIIWVVSYVVGLAYLAICVMLVAALRGVGMLLAGVGLLVFSTVANTCTLYFVAWMLPDNIVLSGFWQTVLSGFLLSLVGLFKSSRSRRDA